TMALQEDPNYALAYAGLADCYMTGSGRYLDLPGAQAIQKGMAVAMKALEIDEALVEAHASIAGSLSGLFDWEASEKEFRRAIELNPNYATARHWYAEALWSMGRHEEAIAQAKRAKELDPLSLIVNTALGVALYFAGRYIESIEQYNYTLELDPNFQLAHYYLGFAYLQQSKFEEAIEELKEAYELMDGPENLAALGYAYALTGKKSEAEKILVELNDLSNSTYVSFLDIAMIYAGLEKKGLALEWLEKAVREKSARVKFLKV
ncbi:tetratricopeptide repeat protein, partial [bacterium]|nr:tetratricopeptide repeat protein [bacterium]